MAGLPSFSDQTKADKYFMGQALLLARKVRGLASPNPGVGAVVVRDNRIVGRGVHVKAGQAHAEVLALAEAGDNARQAAIYVTLEPCHHQGRTPPCTRAILEAGIKRVVYGASDPNPKAAGGGGEFLHSRGLEVAGGIREAQCRFEHRFFFTHIMLNRPHVVLKTAATLDGKISSEPGKRMYITGLAAQRLVHKWRAELDVVCVGANTVKADNPELNCRLYKAARQPLRLVIDSKLAISPQARMFGAPGGQILLACTEQAPLNKRRALERAGAEIMLSRATAQGHVDLPALLQELGSRGMISLMAEAGPTLAWELLAGNLVDEVHYFFAPRLLGGKKAMPMLGGPGFADLNSAPMLNDIKIRRVGHDLLISGLLSK